MRSRRKFFNFRIPVFFTGAFALGIAMAVFFENCGWQKPLILAAPAAFLILCIVYIVLSKNLKYGLIFLAADFLFTFAAIYVSVIIYNYTDKVISLTDAMSVQGYVEEVSTFSTGTRYLVLSDVSLDGKSVGGKLIAYLLDTAEGYCKRGYTVSFYTQVEQVSFIDGGTISYNALSRVKYSCVIAGSITSEYGFSLFGYIYDAIENVLFCNLSEETASVCLALLTGNTDYVTPDTLQAFRYGGIAHVFAVSGLHIGVVYGVITFVFKRIHLQKYASTIIRIVLLVLYSGVCNFSSSSLRAVVMCSTAAAASCLDEKYDSLNALSFSAMIVLCIDPFSLYKTGFLLSFGAMLGIALLAGNFRRFFAFMPKKLSSAFSVGWAAQFISGPVLLVCFGYISTAGLFINVAFIPAISALYMVLFATTLLCLVIPPAALIFLPCAAAPIELIVNVVTICGFENSILCINADEFIYVCFAAMTLGITDKLNIRMYLRGALFFGGVFMLMFYALFPSYGYGSEVCFGTADDGGYAYIKNSDGAVLVVTENVSGVDEYYLTHADALVVVGGDDCYSCVLNLEGSFARVYMRPNVINIPSVGDYEIVYTEEFTECGISFVFDGDTLIVNADGCKFSVCRKEKGEYYGRNPADIELCLYSYGSYDAALFAPNGEYDLSRLSPTRYIFSCGRIFSPVIFCAR